LLKEKNRLKLNPYSSAGYKYLFSIEKGRRKTNEYLFDDLTLNGPFRELLEVAELEAKVYQ